MSQPYESVKRVKVHFNDGSCAIINNHGMKIDAIIQQLTDERAALQAENERLRKAGDAMYDFAVQDSMGIWVMPPFDKWSKEFHSKNKNKGMQS